MQHWIVVFEAQAPNDPASTWKIGIHKNLIAAIMVGGHTERLVRAKLIEEVVSPPLLLIGGWGRGKDDCFVYCGRPGHDFRSEQIESPAPPGRVFLVFVLPDGTIDDWGWRKCVGASDEPQDMKGEIIWPAQ